MRAENFIQAAMTGQRIEQIPKNFDFNPQVERISQVLSHDTVLGFLKMRDGIQEESTDPMIVTGLRMAASPITGHQMKKEPQMSYHNSYL